LTRGQDNILRALLSGADQAALHALVDISSDIDVARITDALGTLMIRHESLRTTYRLGPPMRQLVASDGELMMPVHPVATDPREFAVQLRRRLWARFFDLEQDLPLRAELVTGEGPLNHLVLVVSHMAVDVGGLDIILAELSELLAGRELPPPGRQPLDLVEMESKPAMRSRLQASNKHWEGVLRASPQSLFGVPAPTDRAYHHGLLIRSAPAASAIDRIAKRTTVSRSAVALAAFAVLVSYRTRNAGITITSTAANRFHPALHDYVGTLAMDAVLPVDLSSAETFDQAVTIAARNSLRALWLGSFAGPPTMRRQTFALESFLTGRDGWPVEVGPGRIGDGEARGELDGVQWELRLRPLAAPFEAVHPVLRPFAKTQLVVSAPALAVDGVVVLDGERHEFDGAPGHQAHVFGTRHADRFGWAHATLAGGGWFEGLCARSSPLPELALWATERRLRPLPLSRAQLEPGRLRVGPYTVEAAAEDFVGVTYHDPDGTPLYCYHAERARLRGPDAESDVAALEYAARAKVPGWPVSM